MTRFYKIIILIFLSTQASSQEWPSKHISCSDCDVYTLKWEMFSTNYDAYYLKYENDSQLIVNYEGDPLTMCATDCEKLVKDKVLTRIKIKAPPVESKSFIATIGAALGALPAAAKIMDAFKNDPTDYAKSMKKYLIYCKKYNKALEKNQITPDQYAVGMMIGAKLAK